MKAEIIAIGTEILLGEIIDTNSAYIAQRLPELGIDLYYKSVVGDNLGRIVETFERAWSRSDLIICTGGLGPTDDDLTREGIARLLNEEPYVDPDLERRLRQWFESRGYPMPASNLKQAWLIPSARAIDNPRGTAPGWWVERDGRVIICMPGVPPEMERMWTHEVQPELERRFAGEVLVTRTLKTVGIGEGTVDEMARPLYSTPGVGIGTYARADGVHLRIGAKGRTREEAWARIRPVEEELERIFGDAIWGRDDDTFEGHIADLMHRAGATLAVMESCTGGLLSSTLTDVPGASHYFVAGFVTYQTEQKIALGVPAEVILEHGVVSQETARAMATAARERVGATYGVGVTGVAGPDPQDGVPPGTVHIAVAAPDGATHVLSTSMNQGRQAVKRRAVTTAMLLLRRALLGQLR
ncbi:competence/damage-inducible protein A [Tepidiforma sp.]|uniref:competence/damage-inducible protein A n=1 Tax=Tepidiforma sp. TaxID=2682230 RepID=UPI002ADE56D8|nr:competence/damage-inducible protein A [Tepidiforma sp.]